jgi:hypothetical protein
MSTPVLSIITGAVQERVNLPKKNQSATKFFLILEPPIDLGRHLGNALNRRNGAPPNLAPCRPPLPPQPFSIQA